MHADENLWPMLGHTGVTCTKKKDESENKWWGAFINESSSVKEWCGSLYSEARLKTAEETWSNRFVHGRFIG